MTSFVFRVSNHGATVTARLFSCEDDVTLAEAHKTDVMRSHGTLEMSYGQWLAFYELQRNGHRGHHMFMLPDLPDGEDVVF